MSVYYPASNCSGGAIPKYSCQPCPTYEFGRIRSIGFVLNSYSFTNPSNPTEWNTAFTNNAAIVLWATSGTYDSAMEELVGFGDSESVNGNVTHTLTYKDPYVAENIDFYNAIKDSNNYTIFFRTSSKIWSAGAPVTITPKMPVADDLKSVVGMEVQLKWVKNTLPLPYNIPDGIFNQCYVDL
jgi:hypothetical protein